MNHALAAGLVPGLAGLLIGALLAFAAARFVAGRRIADLLGRLEQMQRARDQANELLLQARRQADLFNKELDLMRRQQLLSRAHGVPSPVIPSVTLPVDPHPQAAPSPVADAGFSDTLVNSRPPGGF